MRFGIPPPGYRLPDATHLGAARLQVSDLEHSLEYYQDIIGFNVLSRDRTSAALGVHGGGSPLIHLEGRPGTQRPPRGGRYGLYHFAILVPDRASLGRFVHHLGEHGTPLASADHAVSEALYLWDPDGLGIEVYADRPRAEWRVHDRELYMTTERLNLQSLAAAGGDEAWNGLPAGTTLGHMHLQVGDLAKAEAFYHAALGFDKIVWSFPGALFLSAGGYHHHLGTNTWAAGVGEAFEHEARLLEWELVLPSADDLERAALSLAGAGLQVRTHDGSSVVSDPWNTIVRLRVG